MNSDNKTFQWVQLLSLSSIHFMIDIFAGLLAVIMPAVQKRFAISMAVGIALLSVMHLTCNFVQILIGHIRENKTSPLLLPIGLIFIGSICGIAALPAAPVSAWFSVPLILITAISIAIIHPEALRCVHTIDLIPPSLVSSVFLNSGYLGYASGGFIGAWLISWFGFKGLYLLAILPVLSFIAMYSARLKMAVENASEDNETNSYKVEQVNFGIVMAMGICATVAPTLLCAMIPQELSRLGFELTFGGVAVMCLTLGSVAGTFFWSYMAHKKSELFACSLALPTGVPFLIGYLMLIDHRAAVALLFITGFFSGSAYPLIVTLARYAKGFNLGRRMGLVVGGAWGTASIILLMTGSVAEKYGIMPVLWITPGFYLLCGLIAIYAKTSRKQL
ncbi:MAG: hypothetical protein KAJ07_01500 [Planctomycetes bacterium]|nr:hypothetical protein [Planctomycetota bacterium]